MIPLGVEVAARRRGAGAVVIGADGSAATVHVQYAFRQGQRTRYKSMKEGRQLQLSIIKEALTDAMRYANADRTVCCVEWWFASTHEDERVLYCIRGRSRPFVKY
jgi:hypothetical protein